MRYRNKLVTLFYVALAIAIWAIFNPGILCDDAWDQLLQAEHGHFTNLHPPLMAIAARAVVLVAGPSAAILCCLQCLAGVFGLRCFCTVLVLAFRGRTEARWLDHFLALGAAAVLLATTPLALYFVTFLKDSWLAIEFLWLGALLVPVLTRADRSRASLAALVALMVLIVLTRHNTIVLLVVFAPLVYLLAPRFRWAWAAVLVLVLLAANPVVNRTFRVEDHRPGDQLLLLDMVGVAVLAPATLDEMPFVRDQIDAADYTREYQFGSQGHLWRILHFGDAMGEAGNRLRREYVRVLLRHPLLLLRTKIRAFHEFVCLPDRGYHFITGIWYAGTHAYTLSRHAVFRARVEDYYRQVQRMPVTGFLQAHVVWMLAGVGLLLFGWLRRWRPEVLLALAVPAVYSNAFVLLTVNLDYRFLLPSTVAMQCLAATALLAYGSDVVRRRAARRGGARRAEQAAGGRWRLSRRGRNGAVAAGILFVAYAAFVCRPYLPGYKPLRPERMPAEPPEAADEAVSIELPAVPDLVQGEAVCLPPSQRDPCGNLNDGDANTVWHSENALEDTFIAIAADEVCLVRTIHLILHRTDVGLGVADLSVLVSDTVTPPNARYWLLRSRIQGDGEFTKSVRVPADLPDGYRLTIEVDRTDAAWRPYRIWGVGCLSITEGHARNWLKSGSDCVSIREIMAQKE